MPIAPKKLEGPATTLTFQGIEMNLVAMSLWLPAEKLTKLRLVVANWLGRRFCTLKELESLLGELQHACKVVRPGRTFMRHMFELMQGARKGQRFLRLNSAFKSDLAWWHLFMEQVEWHVDVVRPGAGKSKVSSLLRCIQCIWYLAVGHGGGGGGAQWFQLPWPREMDYTSIAQKELLQIAVACICIVWGNVWKGQVVVAAHCDNTAAVEVIINSGYGKDEIMMHLLRTLLFVKAHWEIVVRAEHIPGQRNGQADAISRNNSNMFLHRHQRQAELLHRWPPEVMSPTWSKQVVNCLKQDWQAQQGSTYNRCLRSANHQHYTCLKGLF